MVNGVRRRLVNPFVVYLNYVRALRMSTVSYFVFSEHAGSMSISELDVESLKRKTKIRREREGDRDCFLFEFRYHRHEP